MVDLVETPPEHCPGPESNKAGLDSNCVGCPNKEICASQPKGPDPDIPAINEALKNVRHKILVLSGKGGVGKSTFSALLGWGFASDLSKEVAMVDLDFCGPSLARILGTEGDSIHISASGWSPVLVDDNMGLMSIAFMLADKDDAVIWRGQKKNGLIKQFLKTVDWGVDEIDYMIFDTPPGTGDEHISINQYLKPSGLDGAVIVTTPQEVALLDVRKEINFCKKAGIPILGLVENMAGFVCPSCGGKSDIFIRTTGGGEQLAKELGIAYLGSAPLDPRIGQCSDNGLNFVDEYPQSPATLAIQTIISNIKGRLEVPSPALSP